MTAPDYVSQHTVESVTGVRARLYLRLCRELAIPSTKVARDVLARTVDITAYLESRLHRHTAAAASSQDEAGALARAGLRRVAP
jgi:hypothetical protein